jgi:hypothetical protein
MWSIARLFGGIQRQACNRNISFFTEMGFAKENQEKHIFLLSVVTLTLMEPNGYQVHCYGWSHFLQQFELSDFVEIKKARFQEGIIGVFASAAVLYRGAPHHQFGGKDPSVETKPRQHWGHS